MALGRSGLRLRGRGFGRFLDQGGFTDFEAHETRDGDILADLGNDGLNQVADGSGVLPDEGLLVQAHLFIELVHSSLDDLVDHLFGLAFLCGSPALYIALFLQGGGRDILSADELRIGQGSAYEGFYSKSSIAGRFPLRGKRHRMQWLIYNLFMRKASQTDNIHSIAPPTAEPDVAPMPPILPVKREWRAAVMEAVRGPGPHLS